MNTFNYTSIFNEYTTSENISFLLLNRSINLPSDYTLEIYSVVYNDKNIPWTVLSYRLYGTIEYWWILSALNKYYMFYAPEGMNLICINPSYINDVITAINEEL